MFTLNLKLAFRNLLKNKLYTFLNITGFSIGFAACILIGIFYNTETTVNQDFKNNDQIYRLYDVKKNRCNINWNLFPVLIRDFALIENACPLDYGVESMVIKDEKTNTNTGFRHLLTTTESFFSVFSVDLLESLSGKPFDGIESVAISSKVAVSLFGSADPLGRKVNIGNYFYGTVTSVFKELPANSSFSADVILNSANEKFRMSSTTVNGKRYNPTNMFVQLKRKVSETAFTSELNQSELLGSLDIDSLALQPLDEIYLSGLTIKSKHAKGNLVLIRIFLAIGILILLLSSINYLNYSLSIQYNKLRETGIKKTFGAGYIELVSNAVTEVTLGVLISVIFSLFIVDLVLPYSELLFGKELDFKWSFFHRFAPVFLVLILAVIFVNSIAPVYLLSRFTIIQSLSGFKGKSNSRQIWKQSLLVFQLVVSIALISVVMIIFRQLHYVKHSDPGFSNAQLLRINLPYEFQHTDAFRHELENLSFVKNTTLSSGCPGMINHRYDSDYEGRSVTLNCIYAGNYFLETMGIELLKGRHFLDSDIDKTCVLNEEAVKQYGWESFEGKSIRAGQDGQYEVIGIIKDFKFESYHYPVEPLALIYSGIDYVNVLSVRINAGNTGLQVSQIKETWESISPFEPFSFVFYDEFYQSFYLKEEKMAGSITFFTFIAIALTCMGILGQIFMLCLSRVKEIGIRRINGAKVSEVLFLLNRNFLKWITIAFFISTPFSWFVMKKWLENFAYKTKPELWIFLLSGLMVLFLTLMTVSVHSWKAATRNPAEALRYE
jgi:putative ABC transport system permease protein